MTITCPVCQQAYRHRCITSERKTRFFPHLRRVTLALAGWLLGVSVTNHEPIMIAKAYLDFAGSVWDTGVNASPRTQIAPEITDAEERVSYQSAMYLQDLVGDILGSLDQRTLNLQEMRGQCKDLRRTLERALNSAWLVHDGLSQPLGARSPDNGRCPSPEDVQIWSELRELEQMRERLHLRDESAVARRSDTPAERWVITGLHANGFFAAVRKDGLRVDGWAETPEAVPDVLHGWSPAAPPAIRWTGKPMRPPRRLPIWGWIPEHPANVDGGEDLHSKPDTYESWRRQWPDAAPAFRAAIHSLRASWSQGDGEIVSRLARDAERLNAQEPQAPSIGGIICGGERSTPPAATVTTEWLNPAAVAWSGCRKWNEFGSHRPEQVANFARALLRGTDIAKTAEQSWGCPFEPVRLYRIPGPAGPLYELAENGMHRIHAARILRFPLLWAVVTLHALPLEITWYDVVEPGVRLTAELQETIVSGWQNLVRLGHLEGSIDIADGRIQPVWVVAPWLLARPEDAVLWARNYERAYPGALARAGIPQPVWGNPGTWREWLSSAPSRAILH